MKISFDNILLQSSIIEELSGLNGYICYYTGFPHQDTIDYLRIYFREEQFNHIRISVSLRNWQGLSFWFACGFNKITTVECK